MRQIFVCILVIVFVSSCSSHKPVGYTVFSHQESLPETAKIILRTTQNTIVVSGKANFDNLSAAHGNMMYPGGAGAAGFLAAIFTHAAVTDSVKSGQKNTAQKTADKVWDPYRALIGKWQVKDFLNNGQSASSNPLGNQFINADMVAGEAYTLELLPVFLLSENEETLILRCTNRFFRHGQKQAIYQNEVEVLSRPFANSATDYRAQWLNNDAELMKQTMRELLAEAISATIVDARSKQRPKQAEINIEYREGNQLEFERAELVSQGNERVVLRTLRGWLKSLPSSRLKTPLPG